MTTPYMSQPGGSGPYPLVGVPAAPAPVEPMQLLATTGPAGFALQNATPTILTWTAPADGQLHRITVFSTLDVSSALTGGLINMKYTDPGGNNGFPQIYAAAQTAGVKTVAAAQAIVGSGTTVQLNQGSAATAGAAMLWAEIWGS